ncbi:MAG: hypothetical protein DRJ31_02570 [Candidatus Methanomethylicota archaeon]|uniref:CopG family transcriptional regulator n=1 Tax=Thermoproteota archaeon TaxID=2056631 RepID=A0A497F369_9CREN|nr:MAG: hypothetical protein DRJ31_02570 [Candidatus Verstraetearchaeota archaeon]RLE53388.1 MAG: hypothetical protein DRJ33_01195 [Candidatus Verstraetearchaeota archaeon]
MSYVTVSAKIPRKLKELLDKYGIKPGPVIKRSLEEEVKKCMLIEAKKKAAKLHKELAHISDEEIAKIIREDRESR